MTKTSLLDRIARFLNSPPVQKATGILQTVLHYRDGPGQAMKELRRDERRERRREMENGPGS